MRLYSELLASLRDTEPSFMPEIRNKLATKAKAVELGMDVPALYGVFETPDDLDLRLLPKCFALKRHMQPAMVLLMRDGVDQNGVTWTTETLQQRFAAIQRRETSSFVPKLFAEEYIHPPQGLSPREHRFFVIGNVVRFVLVDFDRFEGRKQLVYTPTWKRTAYWSRTKCAQPDHPGLPRPKAFSAMKDFAERFSELWPSPTVTVDVLVADERPVFGEAGVFHLGCKPIHPEWDEMMGKMWLESCGEP